MTKNSIFTIILITLTIPFIISTIILSDQNGKLTNQVNNYENEKAGIIESYENQIVELKAEIIRLETKIEEQTKAYNTNDTNLNQKIKYLESELDSLTLQLNNIKAPYDNLHITTKSRLNPNSEIAADAYYLSTMDLRTPAECTVYEIDSFLEGTGMAGLGEYYLNAQREFGVNAVFLMCKDIIESGWGNSKIATDKNNLSGYGAIDADPYYYAKYFNSKSECVMYVSEQISKNYLTDSGRFFRGYDLYAVNEVYAQNGTTLWVDAISKQMSVFDNYCINLQITNS